MRLLNSNESFALATILSKLGSSPRTAGTKMIVRGNGTIIGTIGGGTVEAEVQRLAAGVMKAGQPIIKKFNLTGADAEQMDMICGGQVEVLIDYIDAADNNNAEVYRQFIASRTERKKAVLVTQLFETAAGKTGSRRCLIKHDGTTVGERIFNDNMAAKLTAGAVGRYPRVLTVEGKTFLVEPVRTSGTLYIFGAGHVAQKLSPLAAMVDFETVVLDDRQEFANRERFKSAHRVILLNSFAEAFKDLKINRDSYLVIVTRGHVHDKTVLQQALTTGAGYIGMIGSKRKRDAIYRALLDEGFTDKDLARVHSPIGLEIEAETPEEIAVSIVAELIKIRAGLNK
nr:XdhC/CoxI family protein [Desulforadius tongensis]